MKLARKLIVATARKYIGTPFQHQGRLLGKGLDCVGLPLCVGEDLHALDREGMSITAQMYSSYGPQPLDRFVFDTCQKHLVWKAARLRAPGDVVSLMVPDVPCHVAILGDSPQGLTLIHAYNSGNQPRVVEHLLDKKWERRIAGIFEFPGVED